MGVNGDDGWNFSFEENPLWKLKLKLQHSGWLQYLLPAIPATFILLPLSLLESYVLFDSNIKLFLPLITLALYGITIFDIITIKYNIHPKEAIPTTFDNISTNSDIVHERKSHRSFQRRLLTTQHKSELLKVADMCMNKSQRLFPNESCRLEFIEESHLKVWPAVNQQQYFVAIAPSKYSKEAIIDLGRSLQKVVLHATRMGLGALWIGPGADHDSITNALGPNRFNPSKDHIICICAVGYKSNYVPFALRILTNKGHKSRLPLTDLFFEDTTCQIPFDVDSIDKSNNLKILFESCQTSPSSYNAQTTRCVVRLNKAKTHIKQIDFCRNKNSKYYATIAVGIWLADYEIVCNQLGPEFKGRFIIDSTNMIGSSSSSSSDDNITKPPSLYYDISWVFDKPLSI